MAFGAPVGDSELTGELARRADRIRQLESELRFLRAFRSVVATELRHWNDESSKNLIGRALNVIERHPTCKGEKL